jgi:hypothetical protein
MKFFLLLVVIAAVFLWLAPKLIHGLGYLLSPPYVMVDKQTEVKGKILNHSANRGKYRYSVEGRRETFDFDNFRNAALGPDIFLGPYLKDGDFVQKAANSDTLRVVRGNERSDWTIAP